MGGAQDFHVTWLHCHPATFILHIPSKYLKLAAKLLIMVLVKNDFVLVTFFSFLPFNIGQQKTQARILFLTGK